ncbi:MAG: aldose 1-epimerase family protein [bacterium]
MNSGPGKDVRVLSVKTGSGFQFSVIPDRGMDIYQAEYQGNSLEWRSNTGLISPYFYEKDGIGWLRNFFGGLLTTCGLTYAGASDEKNGLHGRINNIPADEVNILKYWQNNEYIFEITGVVKEVSVFGDALKLTRKIQTKLGEDKLFIQDKVENIGFKKSPLMIIYHINIGYPLLDSNAKLITNENSIVSRDEEAEKGKGQEKIFSEPLENFKEQVFYFDLKQDSFGYSKVALVNEKIPLGVYVKYKKDTLPRFTEWKMMGCGEYVVGLEPSNCYPEGRKKEKERGTLIEINPQEIITFELEIGILDTKEKCCSQIF